MNNRQDNRLFVKDKAREYRTDSCPLWLGYLIIREYFEYECVKIRYFENRMRPP
jgi:hypothetical protein